MDLFHDASVEFEEVPGGSLPPRVELNARVASGVVMMRHDTAPDRIAKIKGSFNYGIRVQVADESGKLFGVTEILAALISYEEKVMKHILGSWESPISSGR